MYLSPLARSSTVKPFSPLILRCTSAPGPEFDLNSWPDPQCLCSEVPCRLGNCLSARGCGRLPPLPQTIPAQGTSWRYHARILSSTLDTSPHLPTLWPHRRSSLLSRELDLPVAGCRRSTLSSRHGTIPQALHAATQSTAVVSLLSGCSPHLRNFLRLGSCGVQPGNRSSDPCRVENGHRCKTT